MMSVPTPTDVSYGCVAGRIIDIIGDTSSDVGDEPDAIPVSGKISFQPDTKTRKVVSPYKAIAQNRTVVCDLDSTTGIMVDGENREYVKLVVGIYTVTFDLKSGKINPFQIEVLASHTETAPLQLSEAVPYVPPPGSTIMVVPVETPGVVGETLVWDGTKLVWADPAGFPPLPSLTTTTVSGVATVPMVHEGIVEVNATAAATVTLTGDPGTQCAIAWSGAASTVEGVTVTAGKTYIAVRFSSGWKLFEVTAQAADTTPPTPGTLSSSAITSTGFTLTVTGASDAGSGLAPLPYAFSTDNGATYSAWQASNVLAVTGKTASTTYQCKGRVRDVAGNTADTAVLPVTTPTGSKAPDQVGSLFAWFDASASGALTLNGSTVSQWSDKSGNARHVIQATTANQPGTTTLNGMSAVQFIKANTTRLRYQNPFTLDSTVGYTICFVGQFTDSDYTAGQAIFQAAGSGEFLRRQPDGRIAISGSATGDIQAGGTTVFGVALIKNGGPNYVRVGAVKSTSNAATTGNGSTAFQLGYSTSNADPANLIVGELWVHNLIVSDADLDALYVYAKSKWGAA